MGRLVFRLKQILLTKPIMYPGQRVIANGRIGRIRFVGLAEFSAGTWIGVELESPGISLSFGTRVLNILHRCRW